MTIYVLVLRSVYIDKVCRINALENALQNAWGKSKEATASEGTLAITGIFAGILRAFCWHFAGILCTFCRQLAGINGHFASIFEGIFEAFCMHFCVHF
jgi:hypothetical protein